MNAEAGTSERSGDPDGCRGGMRNAAVLLLGVTGSGKTPLGELLARKGIAGRRCVHFDFGAALREIGGQRWRPAGLSEADLAVVRRVLKTGALLEDAEFRIARAVLAAWLAERGVGEGDVVVLNGLPRHAGQAADIEEVVDVKRVVFLECAPETVRERIRLNAGGDRAERVDDDPDLIRRKTEVFMARTLPLLDRYRVKGVRIDVIRVNADTDAETAWRQISQVDAGVPRAATLRGLRGSRGRRRQSQAGNCPVPDREPKWRSK